MNCIIKYNGVGLQDATRVFLNDISDNYIGIEFYGGIVSCNSICNNTHYNVVMQNSINYSFKDNYWCLPDSATIQPTIYDAYQDIHLGFIYFTPIDTAACSNITTAVNNTPATSEEINLFPNPNNGVFTIGMKSEDGRVKNIEIYNVLGEKVYSQFNIQNPTFKIDLSSQPAGLYLYRMVKDDGTLIGEGKLVIQK